MPYFNLTDLTLDGKIVGKNVLFNEIVPHTNYNLGPESELLFLAVVRCLLGAEIQVVLIEHDSTFENAVAARFMLKTPLKLRHLGIMDYIAICHHSPGHYAREQFLNLLEDIYIPSVEKIIFLLPSPVKEKTQEAISGARCYFEAYPKAAAKYEKLPACQERFELFCKDFRKLVDETTPGNPVIEQKA